MRRIMLAGCLLVGACGGSGGDGGDMACPNGFCIGGDMAMGTPPDFTGVILDLAGADLFGCAPAWSCTPWTSNGGNMGVRTCSDANQCGSTANKPREMVMLPALDLDYYKCKVEPIMDQKCSMLGCHGTETGRPLRIYSRGRLRNMETVTETGCLKPGTQVPLVPNCIGSIECICWSGPHTPTEWQKNFDSARSFGLDGNLQPIPQGMEGTSDLIQQPIVGGKAHTGIHLFRGGDPEEVTLKAWLGGAKLGMVCNTKN